MAKRDDVDEAPVDHRPVWVPQPPMTYHIVLNRPTDLVAITEGARAGHNPRHSMAMLAERLDATVHDGSDLLPDLADRFLAMVTRTRPPWWAIARRLRREAKPGDVVFCTGEDVGVPVAALCGGLPGIGLAMMAHYVDRPKGRLALRLFGLKRKVRLFLAVSKPQTRFLSQFVGAAEERVRFIADQTDTDFFRPGRGSVEKARPIIASVGLEQRDYATLAAATAELDVDVRISGFSADTRVLARAFPAAMPANMSRQFYAWPALIQLYRDADIMVVSVHPSRHAAGIQALMEALSCGRPVVVTASEGLEGYLDRSDAMRPVPPGDPDAMRAAIEELLANPHDRARMADRAGALARERHRLERYVDDIAACLTGLRKTDSCTREPIVQRNEPR